MNADKEQLQKAAHSLAMLEWKGRLLFHQQGNDITKREELRALQTEHADQCRMLDMLRRRIPECAEKQYWWDIPYCAETTFPMFTGCFSMSGGIFTEQDNFYECDDMLGRTGQRESVMSILNSYMKLSDYVVLYADKKRMKTALTAPVLVRAILCCEEVMPVTQNTADGQPARLQNPEDSSEYQLMQQEIDSIRRNLDNNIADFERNSDSAERMQNALLTNLGPFTDKEIWLMGQMDSDSYYASELYRDYRESEIREKASDEISRLKYQMRKMKEEAARVNTRQMHFELQQSKAARSGSLRMIRCGYSFYQLNILVGLVLVNRAEKIWNLCGGSTLSPYDIYTGDSSIAREEGQALPNPVSTMEFILKRYGSQMKPYSVLAPRPKNASDELWRCWAEMRFADSIVHSSQH